MLNALPIDQIKNEFLQCFNHHQTIILSAEPGAGKSTRLPLWLLEPAFDLQGKIYLLQPRRVAVRNIANYLAEQLAEPVGQTIGYRLRNETKVSEHTRLEVVTEGVLIQIMQNDPEMAATSVIILDEFHERSLHADFSFALARDIQQGLHDKLTLILMSATLASQELQQALPDAVQLASKGRSYPVEVSYRPANNIQRWREHAITVIKQALSQFSGSILVFLPGSADIRYIEQALLEYDDSALIVCPLYGDLTVNEQQKAISPCSQGRRKIVLATNIAETSLTIEGINLVIDSGLEKVAVYDENTLTNKLLQRNIAKSSAIQRMGRAGRLADGHCIRLYGEEDYQRRTLQNALPITQSDILSIVIEAARWGVTRLAELPLLDLPSQIAEDNAWQTLSNISVVDSNRKLTPHGEQVASLACHARFAHMIITAKALEKNYPCRGLCLLACHLAALLEERDIFTSAQAQANSDIRTRLSALFADSKRYRHRQIINQAQKLARAISCQQNGELPFEYLGVLLYLAFPERLAKRRTSTQEYLASYGKGLSLATDDALVNETFIVVAQLSHSKQQLMIRLAAPVELNQLIDWQLVSFNERELCHYDQASQRIVAVKQRHIGAIVFEEQAIENTPQLAEKIYAAWRQQLLKQGLSLLNWQVKDNELLARWRWLTDNQHGLNFPNISEQKLIERLDEWFQPFVGAITTKAQLAKLDLSTMLLSLLDYQQQQKLEQCAPRYFVGPTGRKCPIRYSLDKPPIVSLPMQEVYGMQSSPSVGQGNHKVNLTLELLSPAQRPIQITSDLAGFWQGSYKAVQKEMKAKYPKHVWPDDPANAQATNKTKRHLTN